MYSDLSNKPIFEKVSEITPRIGDVKCKYSLKYYHLLNAEPKSFFEKYPSFSKFIIYFRKEFREHLDRFLVGVVASA